MLRFFRVLLLTFSFGFSCGDIRAAPLDEGMTAVRRGDDALAFKLLRPIAETGNSQAQNALGLIYYRGIAVQKDYNEAARWFRLSAEQRFALGQANLGNCYRLGRGVAQDYNEALRLYRLSADQGNALGQNNLGVMYNLGLGITRNPAEAVRLFRLAAGQGHPSGQANLGVLYAEGKVIQRDYNEAVRLLKLAASQGNAAGQSGLGVMYKNGWGIPRNYPEALGLFRLSAGQGNARGEFGLGQMYFNGLGVAQDYVRAHMWFNLAAAQGHEQAAKHRSELANLMTAQQVALAQQMAGVCSLDAAKCGEPAWVGPTARRQPPNDNSVAMGSGFFVSPRGMVLTNAHVVRHCREISIATDKARLIAKDEINDLALLEAPIVPPAYATWRVALQQGEEILAYGFPLRGVISEGGVAVPGFINALEGIGNDVKMVQISAPIQPGNSGGPVLDKRGNVVAVVVSTIDAMKVAKFTGSIPQNVNFAIKALVAVEFLKTHGVSVNASDENSASLPTPEITQRGRNLSVAVSCIR